jgi:hypothetical protein
MARSLRAAFWLCLLAGLTLSGAGQAKEPDIRFFNGERCINGMRLVTYDEAVAHKDQLCRLLDRLGEWSLVRIANGGAMGGRRYKCDIERQFNFSKVPVGASMCINNSTPF